MGSPRDIESHLYVSWISETAVFATLGALEARFDVPVVFCASPDEAGRLVESWVYWYAREVIVAANDLARGHGLTRAKAALDT